MQNNSTPVTLKHLLLVDDDRLVLVTMAQALNKAGYRITTAESADEAEIYLSDGLERPQLVILDVQMPRQNGLTLVQRLRDLDHIPFMMLSAYSDAETVQLATAQGALGYVVKPVDPAQLVPAIEAALARANDLQELRTTRMQLQTALDNERDINLAVGITMMQHHLSRKAAFEMLRQGARRQQRKLAEVAQSVIHASETLRL